MSSVIDFSIEMLSDWRVGSGKGRQGSVDELVQRDEDGLPFIPVTTLRGIWRDSAEQLAFALDDGQDGGDWRRAVDALFGSQPVLETDLQGRAEEAPIASRLIVSPARMSSAVRNRLAGENKARLREAMTFVKPGVAIDSETGTAREKHLRFQEVSRSGALMSFQAEMLASDEKLRALALCSAAMITSLGAERRRGMGKCRVSVPDLKEAVELLKDAKAPDISQNPASPSDPVRFEPGREADFDRYEVKIEFLSPVIIADEILGNTVTTLSHIPGTLLLGAVLEALGGNLHSAVVNGDVRVLPAYPMLKGKRSLPTPACWRQEKDDPTKTVRNGLAARLDKSKIWKGLAEDFFVQEEQTISFAQTSVAVFTHNTVEDQSQTPTSDVGGVYTYEALSSGQVFAAELWIRKGLLSETGVPGPLEARLGRATAAGYGHVRLSFESIEEQTGTASDDTKTVLYFSSDCQLPSCDSALNGLALTLKAAGIEAEISQLSLKLVRHEGWMPRAGLPKPSRLAIGAGSVCVLDCDPAKVQQILAAGLGLRRAEGFGVVQINSPFVTAPLSANSHGEDCDRWEDDGKAHELNGNDQPYLKQVENTCVRERIRERAEILVSKVSWRKDNLGWSEGAPNMSQLGNLRAFMGRLESEADINAVSTYLRGVKPDWGGKVLALFENSPLIWEWLKGVQLSECAIVSTPEEIMTDKTFRRYAILCLLSAAMRAHKRGLEKLELENT